MRNPSECRMNGQHLSAYTVHQGPDTFMLSAGCTTTELKQASELKLVWLVAAEESASSHQSQCASQSWGSTDSGWVSSWCASSAWCVNWKSYQWNSWYVNWKSYQCRTALMWGGWQIFPIYTSRRRGRIQKLTQRRAVTIANQLCVPNLLLTCRTAYFAKLLKIEHRSLQSVTVFDKQARQPSTIRLSFGTFGKLCTLHIHASMHLTQQCSCCPKVRWTMHPIQRGNPSSWLGGTHGVRLWYCQAEETQTKKFGWNQPGVGAYLETREHCIRQKGNFYRLGQNKRWISGASQKLYRRVRVLHSCKEFL